MTIIQIYLLGCIATIISLLITGKYLPSLKEYPPRTLFIILLIVTASSWLFVGIIVLGIIKSRGLIAWYSFIKNKKKSRLIKYDPKLETAIIDFCDKKITREELFLEYRRNFVESLIVDTDIIQSNKSRKNLSNFLNNALKIKFSDSSDFKDIVMKMNDDEFAILLIFLNKMEQMGLIKKLKK